MTARDDYPRIAAAEDEVSYVDSYLGGEATEALDEIDRLRHELETCERRNETLRRHCQELVEDNRIGTRYRRDTGYQPRLTDNASER